MSDGPSISKLLQELMGHNRPSSARAPKMEFVLRALEDTRTFLEARYDQALDANDKELSDAYAYSLQQFRHAILSSSADRGMRYLADWAIGDVPGQTGRCANYRPAAGPKSPVREVAHRPAEWAE